MVFANKFFSRFIKNIIYIRLCYEVLNAFNSTSFIYHYKYIQFDEKQDEISGVFLHYFAAKNTADLLKKNCFYAIIFNEGINFFIRRFL